MKNGTDRYIETVAYLGKLYDYANGKLFGGELVKPVITVQTDERNKTNGWWSRGKVWKWKDTVPANCGSCEVAMECCENPNSPKYVDCKEVVECEEHELNMTAQQLNRPIGEIAATLIHEMCHQYATIHEMKDTSRSGNYHNKLFKKIAETHGLNVECVPKIGWSHTTLTDETAAKIAAFTAENPPTVIYRLPIMKSQITKNTSTRKYVCPVCGQSVRATKRVNIMCMDCNAPMAEEE